MGRLGLDPGARPRPRRSGRPSTRRPGARPRRPRGGRSAPVPPAARAAELLVRWPSGQRTLPAYHWPMFGGGASFTLFASAGSGSRSTGPGSWSSSSLIFCMSRASTASRWTKLRRRRSPSRSRVAERGRLLRLDPPARARPRLGGARGSGIGITSIQLWIFGGVARPGPRVRHPGGRSSKVGARRARLVTLGVIVGCGLAGGGDRRGRLARLPATRAAGARTPRRPQDLRARLAMFAWLAVDQRPRPRLQPAARPSRWTAAAVARAIVWRRTGNRTTRDPLRRQPRAASSPT